MSRFESYACRVGGRPAIVSVDLDLADTLPDPRRTWLVQVAVEILFPDEDTGLSTHAEGEDLDAITQTVVSGLVARWGAVPLGWIETAGRRELYLHTDRPDDLQEAVDEVTGEWPEYTFDVSLHRDRLAQHYETLMYPSVVELQVILNARQVEGLESQGDSVELPRPVHHTLVLPTGDVRRAMAELAEREGYAVQPMNGVAEDGALLELVSVQPVTIEAIDATACWLAHAAQQLGGRYDGWGCEVTSRPAAEA